VFFFIYVIIFMGILCVNYMYFSVIIWYKFVRLQSIFFYELNQYHRAEILSGMAKQVAWDATIWYQSSSLQHSACMGHLAECISVFSEL